ncbi:S8 family serine peptidase [candidate division KSB1 bacterium]|nr:S8 family serine peptidase [candidate division KSB1 bacterium]
MPGESEKYWFFFTDKGPINLKKSLNRAGDILLPKAQARRAKVKPADALVDFTDLPVYQNYIQEIKNFGITPVNRSKWLNAISAYATAEQISLCSDLSFILKIHKVRRGKRLPPDEQSLLFKETRSIHDFSLDYGPSFVQNDLVRIPEIHSMGYQGQGVLIAVLDTGFHLEHIAFSNIHVVAAWDFINKDGNVDNEESQDVSFQNLHGTIILSLLAGYRPGRLIGAAWGADYLLAKTEIDGSETPVEEDYWIAAAEWADSLGADIISTSLGYTDWYTNEDMNGTTAPVTIAADLAVEKGIIVVTSAGNEGNSNWGIIGAPADGKHVISVGAVDKDGVIAGFSSRGPTADGRIKPEVVAMGVNDYGVNIYSDDYVNVSGTSASCPLVAGVAALLLTAHPLLNPGQVREALLNTAGRNSSPDNTYGYGLVDAVEAVQYWGQPAEQPKTYQLVSCYPNPFDFSKDNVIRILFDVPTTTDVKIEIFNLLGQKVITLWNGTRQTGKNQRLYWDGRSYSGNILPSGVYFCRVTTGSYVHTTKLTLFR